MKLAFACETIRQVRAEITPMFDLHYEEVGQKDLTLLPDWARFTALESAGVLVIFTVRAEGRLIGYSVFFVQPHIHYSGTVAAINDVIFILPEFRGGTAGVRLVKHSETGLKARGVGKIYYHAKPDTPLVRLLEAYEYRLMESIYSKRIA